MSRKRDNAFIRIRSLYLKIRFKYRTLVPIIIGFLLLLTVFAYGMFIFIYIEGWNTLDSFYQVVITLSTVGFQENYPLSDNAKLLTSILILMGVGSFAYLVGTFTQILVEGKLQDMWGKRRVQKIINSFDGHCIVCGYGRIGSVVAKEIRNEGRDVVVIENKSELLSEIAKDQLLYVYGDATSDEILLSAGIKKADALIACLDQVAENMYITLTARQFNSKILIVVRGDKEESLQKLKRAGADKVLTPHKIGGMRMAQLVVRPTVTDFIDLTMHGHDLQMEELLVGDNSELVGKDLITSQIRPRFNVIVIAIEKKSKKMIFNPQPQTVIEAKDTLVVVGNDRTLNLMRDIL